MEKYIALTEDELRTLLWAVQNQHATRSLALLRSGKMPKESNTIQRLNSISKKAYAALVAGKDLTK